MHLKIEAELVLTIVAIVLSFGFTTFVLGYGFGSGLLGKQKK